jgi:hypothetical protein
MDDLILAGALSVTALYSVMILAVVVIIFTLADLFSAAFIGDTSRVIAISCMIMLFLAIYAGTGLWLQKSGRI